MADIINFPALIDQDSLMFSHGVSVDWDNVAASRKDSVTGKKVIEAYTVMKKTASAKWVPVDADVDVSTLTDWGLIASDAYEDEAVSAADNYGLLIGGSFYTNMLPDYKAGNTTLAESIDGKKGFVLVSQYVDSRV